MRLFKLPFQTRKASRGEGPRKPVVLMHIAETTGTAVRLALAEALGQGPTSYWVETGQLASAWRTDPWNLAGKRLISGHFGTDFINHLPFPVFRASFVRDPVERCLSHYRFTRDLDLSRLSPKLASRVAESRTEPLERLLASSDPFLVAQYSNHQARQFAGRSPMEPGERDIEPGNDLLERALDQATKFEFVGLHEQHLPSMQLLFRLLDLTFDSGRHAARVDTGRTYVKNPQIHADEPLRALIRKHNEADIALYEALVRRFETKLREAEPDGKE